MSSCFNETLESEIAAIDAEIAAINEATKAQLTMLRERKRKAQELRRTYPTPARDSTESGGTGVRSSTRRKRTARKSTRDSQAAQTATPRAAGSSTAAPRRARRATAGVPYAKRREQVLKVITDSKVPVGSTEIAKALKLTVARARQLVDQMLGDNTLTATKEVGPQKRKRRVFSPGANARGNASPRR